MLSVYSFCDITERDDLFSIVRIRIRAKKHSGQWRIETGLSY